MTRLPGLWAALGAAALATMIDLPARAGEPQPLPAGISRGADGRYYQDACDHSLAFHCMWKRQLPESFDPELTPPPKRPLAGGFCAGQGGGGSPTPVPNTMTPADVQAAYSIPATAHGYGKIVSVIDMPDSHAYADLNAYRAGFNLPALPQCPNGLPDGKTPCFAQVDETGHPNSTTGDCPGGDIETAIDVDMASAACPDCSILLVQMTSADMTQGPTDGDFLQGAQTSAMLGAVATSISFGGIEYAGQPTGYTTPGHLVLAASGDSGYLLIQQPGGGSSPGYPASAPDVLGVGGTTLVSLGGGNYGEKVWNDSVVYQGGGATTSGCSIEFPMPTYQTAFLSAHANAFGSCTKRDSVDLAAAAEFASGQGGGISVYEASSQWTVGIGTSAASPMIAALFTRVGVAEKIANDMGFVYANIAAFNDITSGTNAVGNSCTDDSCVAGTGWDGPTGVGSPNGTKLVPLGTPNQNSSSSSGGGSDGGASEGGTTTDGGSGSSSGGVADGGSGSGSGSSGGDAGSGSGGGSSSKSGCSCTTAGHATSMLDGLGLLAMGAGALVLVRRRRNRA